MKKIIIFLLIVLSSCTIISEDDGLWSGYWLKEGRHWAVPYEIRTNMTDTISFDFIIHADTEYPNLGEGFESDWNKLGYVCNGAGWHKNSATFVWKWMDGDDGRVLWLGWYGWKDGISPQENKELKKAIGIIQTEVRYEAMIICGDPVVFWFDGVEYISTLSTEGGVMWPPYFGGQATAPHDMHITLMVEK